MNKITIAFLLSTLTIPAFADCVSLGKNYVSCKPGYFLPLVVFGQESKCTPCPYGPYGEEDKGQTSPDRNTGGIAVCTTAEFVGDNGYYKYIGYTKTFHACNAGYYLHKATIGGACTKCPDNGKSVDKNSEGITACTGMYDATGWYAFNTDGTKKYTKCVAGYYLENAKCEPCPDGKTSPNENTGGSDSCQIRSDVTGYFQEIDGKKIYSMCKAGYYLTSEKICVECPDHGKSPDKNSKGITACTEMYTSTGWYEFDASGVAKYIKCVANYYLKNAECNSCPSGGKSPDKNTGGITSCYTITREGTDATGKFETKDNTECHYVE